MKNYRAPRNLSECEFTVGYPQATAKVISGAKVVAVLALFAFIGIILGTGF